MTEQDTIIITVLVGLGVLLVPPLRFLATRVFFFVLMAPIYAIWTAGALLLIVILVPLLAFFEPWLLGEMTGDAHRRKHRN